MAGGVLLVGLFYHLPFAIGVRRVFSVQSKLDCIRSGNYPDFLAPDATIPLPPASQVLPVPSHSKMERPSATSVSPSATEVHKF